MIEKSVDLYKVVDILNEACQLDPKAMFDLINARVSCNKELAYHPTIQVGTLTEGEYRVGIIGILNGLFGVDEDQWGCIAANIDIDNQSVYFSILEDRIK